MEDFITDNPSGFSQNDLIKKREEFIKKYCDNKGWDKNNLSVSQMFEITQSKQYSNPFMINS